MRNPATSFYYMCSLHKESGAPTTNYKRIPSTQENVRGRNNMKTKKGDKAITFNKKARKHNADDCDKFEEAQEDQAAVNDESESGSL